ncbi:MAG: GNAT family N-acetyltransferase [Spirochaetes bacterium]|nr:GNAT family N-acetyltransferase [Spirochaetota bacterium]
MKILRVDINDSSTILDLQTLSYRQEAEIYNDYTIPPLTQTLDEIKNDFNDNIILKAVIDDTIVGSVRAYVKDYTCYIGRLIVHPDHQNKSIGTGLMKKIEKYFTVQGIKTFELFTGEKSEKNLYLYRKLGYEIFKEEKMNDNVNIVSLHKILYKHNH